MRLARHLQLDALIGEYTLGTLRGGARRRFERALREEPAWRCGCAHCRSIRAALQRAHAQTPSAAGWQRLARELNLLQPPRALVLARVVFCAAGRLVRQLRCVRGVMFVTLRTQQDDADADCSTCFERRAAERHRCCAVETQHACVARRARPIVAGPSQSYELWVIPQGGAPLSLAVLGQVDGILRVPEGHRAQLRKGAVLAITVEPAGGSPTGGPTGPVILSGAIS